MTYCPICGREIEDDTITCPYCGFELREPGADENAPGEDPSRDDSPTDYDGSGTEYDDDDSGTEYDYDDSGDSDEPSGAWGKFTAAAAGFFGDGPENKGFIVVGVAMLAAVLVAGGILAHGLFFKKTGSAGPGEVASNTGVTSSSTGANNGTTAKPSSATGKDD